MIRHPPNLDRKQPKTFASHFALEANSMSKGAKERLKKALIDYGTMLEDSEKEMSLYVLCKKITSIENPFEITEELRKQTFEELDNILR